MTPKQQQRLIGTLLLVFFIAVLAYLVLSQVSKNESSRQIPVEDTIPFSSVIEPLGEDSDEVQPSDTFPAEEAFVDIDANRTENSSQASNESEISDTQPEPVIEQTETELPKAEPAPSSPAAPEVKPEPAPVVAAEPSPTVTPTPAPIVDNTSPASQAADNKQTESSNQTAEPTAGENGSRWILQLGSFSVEANATSLKKQLEELGYKPMIEQTQSGGTVIYRVRLQPNQDRAALERTAQSIRNELNLNTQIFPYP